MMQRVYNVASHIIIIGVCCLLLLHMVHIPLYDDQNTVVADVMYTHMTDHMTPNSSWFILLTMGLT